MNITDLFFLLVIFVSAAFALYRGFISSLLGAAVCVLSLAFAFWTGPSVARFLAANQGLGSMIATYTDAGSLIGDYALAHTPVYALNTQALESALKSISLPEEMQSVLQSGLQQAIQSGDMSLTVNNAVTNVVVWTVLRISSFILCFFAGLVIGHFLINLISHVFPFPILVHFDSLLACILGIARGVMVVYVILMAIPLIRTFIPFDPVSRILDQSRAIALIGDTAAFIRIAAGGGLLK